MKRFFTKQSLYYLVFTSIFIIFAFWILAVKNAYLLKWLDEMSLFEPGMSGLKQYLMYPGGIFRFAGTFLTQFLFYPALGSAVLILLWVICVWLAKYSFRLSGSFYPLSFIMPFCMLVSVLHFDEAALTFESQGYVFYNTLGFLFSLILFSLYKGCHDSLLGKLIITTLSPLTYPIAGFFSLLSAIMCVISFCFDARCKDNRRLVKLIVAVITLFLIVVTPLIYYRYFNGTTADSFLLYFRGLPELTLDSYDVYLWCPFIIASLALVVLTVLISLVDFSKFINSKLILFFSSVFFVVGIILSFSADNRKSEQFHASVLMVNAIENNDWNKVINIMSLTKESPNYTMCVLDNLARANTHNGRRDLSNMSEEFKDPRHAEQYTITAFVNVPVNYQIGRFNQSHHWATEHIVQYGYKVFFIKYIVLNAIMNGDMQFAKKFNRLLMNTMFHRRWAEEMNKYIEHPELVKTMPGYDRIMNLRYEEMLRGE